MTDSIIERQAIRAALALAIASAHAQTPDAIADMRDEAAQLIGLCIKESGEPDAIRQWCEDASVFIERLSSDGYLPRRSALTAGAAILRLRLAVVRISGSSTRASDVPVRAAKKKVVQQKIVPIVLPEGNQKTVMEFIAAHPDIRTKDLVDALKGSLSPRSIKRCLKELLGAGLLHRKKLDDGSVLYRVDSRE